MDAIVICPSRAESAVLASSHLRRDGFIKELKCRTQGWRIMLSSGAWRDRWILPEGGGEEGRGLKGGVRGTSNSCLTLLVLLTSLAMFSSVNLSALFCLSRNIREPRLDERLSSSIITSFGTLIFFPRFRPPDRRTQSSQDALQSYLLRSFAFFFISKHTHSFAVGH